MRCRLEFEFFAFQSCILVTNEDVIVAPRVQINRNPVCLISPLPALAEFQDRLRRVFFPLNHKIAFVSTEIRIADGNFKSSFHQIGNKSIKIYTPTVMFKCHIRRHKIDFVV